MIKFIPSHDVTIRLDYDGDSFDIIPNVHFSSEVIEDLQSLNDNPGICCYLWPSDPRRWHCKCSPGYDAEMVAERVAQILEQLYSLSVQRLRRGDGAALQPIGNFMEKPS
jgi:hypothetical protein